ncbi:alpha-1,3-glucanase/mutanase [Flagelloscypha sp. PMI_526]|nr:alpha-1,3-glucanase/mutanase [Flagelloscypha sp. PMI_526]
MRSFFSVFALAFLAPWALALTVPAGIHTDAVDLDARQASSKLVFAHFMIGIVSNRNSAAGFDLDMQKAKALGIDAFALNIGVDPYTDTQLGYAYDSAANNGMKVFISFDFNWYNTGQGSAVGSKVAAYASKPAQLFINGAAVVSSFAGDGVDVGAIRSAAGRSLFVLPNFHPGGASFDPLDGAFNWMAWPNDGNNKAPKAGQSVSVAAGDTAYKNQLGSKPYMAPASPWFFTHFGPEVTYSKNWVFPGDLLWYQRWIELLKLQPAFIEVETWNDYGESHYIGPLASTHTDDGGSKWVNDMPHSGWLDMSKPFIAAYKAGATDVTSYITQDELIYWYRTTKKSLNCDSTDTTMQPANNASGNYFMGRPDGWDSMQDNIFVVAMLTAAGTVTVNSAGTLYTYNAPKGASAFQVPFGIGSHHFALSRNGNVVTEATSLKVTQDTCPCGLYNFNAYVGTVPASATDQLDSTGLAAFTNGLKVACEARPSLPASPPATTAATVTSTATAAPTASQT